MSDETAEAAVGAEQEYPWHGGKPGGSKHYSDTQDHDWSDEHRRLHYSMMDTSCWLKKVLLNKGWGS